MRKRKILFIDDESHVTDALKRAFRGEPYEILTANSAEEGLETLERCCVDVVVSDEQMPGMAGSEFLAKVCKKYPGTIRMVLTGQASVEAAIRAINEGEVYRFFTKPCCAAEMKISIQQALQQKRLVEQSRRLLHEFKTQASIIQRLEATNPGLTQLRTDEDGAILVDNDDADIAELLEEIDREMRSD